jgi:hypothetical protein
MDATTLTADAIFFGASNVQSIVSSTAASVTVMPPTGTAGTTVDVYLYNGSTMSNTVPYTYFSDPTACPGDSSNRGYIDEPRADGNAQSLLLNVKLGIDHNLHTYQTYKLAAGQADRPTPAAGTKCSDLDPSTILESPSAKATVPDINCLRLKGGAISSFESGFFDSDGRMYMTESGQTTGTIGTYSGVDIDDLFSSRFVDPANAAVLKTQLLAGASPTPAQEGWIKDAILKCPRFAILPVTSAPSSVNGTEYYPIIGFKGVFITSLSTDTSTQHGFGFANNNKTLRTLKGFVFDLKWLHSNISSDAVTATQAYIGTGPVIAKLVRDQDDGTY